MQASSQDTLRGQTTMEGLVMRLTQTEIEAREVRRVIHLACRYAKNAVLHSIKAQGLRPANYSYKEIMIWTDLHFADHREMLLAQARAELLGYAQQQNPYNSTTSAVRMSGAK
jgi:hypothetical protein